MYLALPLAFGKLSTLRGSDYISFLRTDGRPGGGYEILTYFHARSSSPVQWLHRRQVEFPTARFLSFSSMCREFIGFFHSHSTRYFSCRFSETTPRLSTASILVRPPGHLRLLWLPPLLKWPGGELDDSVSVGLPCHQRRDVHPFYLLLRRVVVATGERDPRNCIKVRPYEQLLTPSAVAGFHALRDQPSATAGAIVTAARRVKTFTCVL